MNELTDQQLLRNYSGQRSEAAFAELVRRHVDLVHSAAVRMVYDAHLAEDVTQGAFLALAQNARQLVERPVLSGWLHRTAQNLASKAVRSEVRRRAREQEAAAMNELLSAEPDAAWEYIAPHLDAALSELSEPDRDAVLLRYFERKSAREMAQTLGISDDAAQRRVSRAVERLRESFTKRGISAGASGLAAIISANAVQAAPVGLTATISTAVALAGTLTVTTLATQSTLTTMNWISAKSIAAIVASALVAGTGTYLVQQRETNQLRTENQNLSEAQRQLSDAREAALTTATNSTDETERLQKEKSELLRLRGEVGLLRRQLKELEDMREMNRELQAALEQVTSAAKQNPSDANTELLRQVTMAKLDEAKMRVLGLLMYVNDNHDHFPTEFNQVSKYWGNADDALTKDMLMNTNQFEIVVHGSVMSITNPASVIAIREKEAIQINGKWFKTYGYVDGHSEFLSEPQGGFEAWEKARMIAPPTNP